jgi:hypothetical protein
MKRVVARLIFLFSLLQIIFLFNGNYLQAQEVCNDTIYPLKAKGIITDCCIQKVENENFVIYTKNGQNYGVEAKAIIKNGLHVPLAIPDKPPAQIEVQSVTPKVQKISPYKYDYEKYSQRYRTGKTVATIGGFVAVTGVAMSIGAVVSNNNGNMSYDRAETLIIVGFFAFNFGVPTTIIGLAMARNSKQAMIRTKKQSLDISLGFTGNGVGLVMNF